MSRFGGLAYQLIEAGDFKFSDIKENTEPCVLAKLTYKELLDLENECNEAFMQAQTARVYDEEDCIHLCKILGIIKDAKSLSERGIV